MAMTVGEVLRRADSLRPRSVAASLDGESLTFADVHRRANQTAHALAGVGIVEGDRIASWTDISLRALGVFFGAARLGSAYAPLNPSLSPEEAMTVLSYLRPRVLVLDDTHVAPG